MTDWFTTKRYGWGWTPSTWQGWLLTAAFVGYIYYISKTGIPGSKDWWFKFIISIVVFLIITYTKGPTPTWRWG